MKLQEVHDRSIVKWIESNPNYNIDLNPYLNPLGINPNLQLPGDYATTFPTNILEPFEGIKKKNTRIILLILLILVIINYLIYIL